jgi:hypothetical protein
MTGNQDHQEPGARPAEEAGKAKPFAFDFRHAFKQELEAVAFRREYMASERPLPEDYGKDVRNFQSLRWPSTKEGEDASAILPQGRYEKRIFSQGRKGKKGDLSLYTSPLQTLPQFTASGFDILEPRSPEGGTPPSGGDKKTKTNANPPSDWRPGDPVTGADRLNLTGMALSGGGIRSSAVCMGVLQGIDSLSAEGSSRILDRLDYLSTVSGGNYMGTSVANGMMQDRGTFPYESKTDQAETPETQHLRDHSSFLVPNGLSDYFSNIYVILRGLVANAVMVLPVLLLLALTTILFNSASGQLRKPDVFGWFEDSLSAWPSVLGTMVLTPIAIGLLVLFMVYWTARKKFLRLDSGPSLSFREKFGKWLGLSLFGIGGLAFIEWQPAILAAMFEADLAAASTASRPPINSPADAVARFFAMLGDAGHIIAPVAVAFVATAQKLLNVAKATLGDATWTGSAKRVVSKLSLYALGLIVPLLLWILYLNLSFWGISGPNSADPYKHAPAFLKSIGDFLVEQLPAVIGANLGQIALAYVAIALALIVPALFFGPNANSLNALYRDRLARAFLTQRKVLLKGGVSEGVDGWTFTSLKPLTGTTLQIGAAFAPYLLVNTAINIQGSKLLNRRGRNADVFTLGPLASGSDATGYVPTPALENADPNLTLATGMAISGAAASANMGGNTIPALTFSLAMLNVRLGYWLFNPARMAAMPAKTHRDHGCGPAWFFRELFGRIKDSSSRVYLTDGGHIENLGLYELLKRRCRVIIVVDAEADQGMVFPSLVRVQMLARIDHGVTLQLPWPRIAAAAREANKLMGTADEAKLYDTTGPHVSVGRIVYRRADETPNSQDVHGVLIYIKSSLTGDENDGIRDYKRRHPDFPHETTLDQFFSEEQFEVYRGLGFHMARGFFNGYADAAFWTPSQRPEALAFLEEVRDALASIGVPPRNIDSIIDRALKQMAAKQAAA